MKPAELLHRRIFDYRVLTDMPCPTFDFEAYRTTIDLERRRRRIVKAEQASDASKYRFHFRVPTLVGPGKFADETEIFIDTEVIDYPLKQPWTWILSSHVPWSPHFRRNSPVCIGDEFWEARQGHVTLGHLAIHLARLLNWDEKGRGGGYVGWNGEAIEYHRRNYEGRPLNPDIVYPSLPAWLAGSTPDDIGTPAFEITARSFAPMTFQRL